MATPYLAISDGTTTLSFSLTKTGSSTYVCHEWNPGVTSLRQSQLGGAGPYDEVEATMDISVYGTSVDNCLSNLSALAKLLDQADRFNNGENVAAVMLKYAPSGSTVSSDSAPLQALILGSRGGGPALVMPSRIDYDVVHNKAVSRLQVRFVRRGLWLLTDQTGSTYNVSNGDIVTVDLTTALSYYSPTYTTAIGIGIRGVGGELFTNAFVLMANSSTDLAVYAAEGATATAYTSVADASAAARNTNVLRYTPVATTEALSGSIDISAQAAKSVAVFASIRNNSATTTFKVRARLTSGGNAAYTPYTNIAVSSGPQWYFVGKMVMRTALDGVRLAITASAAADTLDIDSIVCMSTDCAENKAVTIIQPGGNLITGPTITYLLNTEYDTGIPTSVEYTAAPSIYAAQYSGDPALSTKGRYVYWIVLQCGGTASANYWRVYVSGAVTTIGFETARRIGYVTPV